MTLIAPIIRKMQTKFELKCPGGNLEDDHLARNIVYLINQFEKEKPYLFPERNIEGKIGPKFKNDLKEMLGLHIFATFRLQRTCRKIESFLTDNNEVSVKNLTDRFILIFSELDLLSTN